MQNTTNFRNTRFIMSMLLIPTTTDEGEDDQYGVLVVMGVTYITDSHVQWSLLGHAQGRAVAEVRNPQHKHEEMIHRPDFSNFISHKPWPLETLPLSFCVFAVHFCVCCMFSKCYACVVKLMRMFS